MLRRWRRRRSKRRGLTTVEYAIMLFLVAVTGVFGIPQLAKGMGKAAASAGQGIETAGKTLAETVP